MDGRSYLLCTDYRGRKVVFTQAQRTLKARKRPELLDVGIIERIRETLAKPSFVYDDFEHENRLVYYRSEYTIDRITRYMKVVVEDQGSRLFVVTAFRPDYVKERGKTTRRYGTDSY